MHPESLQGSFCDFGCYQGVTIPVAPNPVTKSKRRESSRILNQGWVETRLLPGLLQSEIKKRQNFRKYLVEIVQCIFQLRFYSWLFNKYLPDKPEFV